jgi:hypothetical protein
MTVTNANNLVSILKKEHEKKIENLNLTIESLQEEIRLIKLFNDRLDDL